MRKMTLGLQPSQIVELETLAHQATDPDVSLRARALLHLVDDQGYRAAARAVSVNESAVRKWHAAYRAEGVAGLRTRARSGRPTKLTQADRHRLWEALKQSPQTFGFAGDTWTARALNEYLQAHSTTRVSDWTIWALMRDMQRAAACPNPSHHDATPPGHSHPGLLTEREIPTPQSVNWTTVHELAQLRQRIDCLLEERWLPSRTTSSPLVTQCFPINMYTTDTSVILSAALPGLETNNVDIVFQNRSITIRGETQPPDSEIEWITQEYTYGKFSRTVPLSMAVDMCQADVHFENGILTLRLPKAESAPPYHVSLKAK